MKILFLIIPFINGCRWPSSDVLFILDSTQNISPFEFQKQLQFLQKIVNRMHINADGTQSTLALFTPKAKFIFSLSEVLDKNSLLGKILSTSYTPCDTTESLESCKPFASINSIAKFALNQGNRKMMPDVIIVISSGKYRIPELLENEVLLSPISPIHAFHIMVGTSGRESERYEASANTLKLTSVDFNSLEKLEIPLCESANVYLRGNASHPSTFSPLCWIVIGLISLVFLLVLCFMVYAVYLYKQENKRLRRQIAEGEYQLVKQNEYFTSKIHKQMEDQLRTTEKYNEEIKNQQERFQQVHEREREKANSTAPPTQQPQPIIIYDSSHSNTSSKHHKKNHRRSSHKRERDEKERESPREKRTDHERERDLREFDERFRERFLNPRFFTGLPYTYRYPEDTPPPFMHDPRVPHHHSGFHSARHFHDPKLSARENEYIRQRMVAQDPYAQSLNPHQLMSLSRMYPEYFKELFPNDNKDSKINEEKEDPESPNKKPRKDVEHTTEDHDKGNGGAKHPQKDSKHKNGNSPSKKFDWKNDKEKLNQSLKDRVIDGNLSDDGSTVQSLSTEYSAKLGHLSSDHPSRILPPIDLLFLVDSSSSIGISNFENIKQSICSILEDVDIAPGRSRIAVVQFAQEPSIVFGFDKYFSLDSVQRAIDRVTYSGGATALGRALSFVAGVLWREQNMTNGKHRKHKWMPTPRHDRLQILCVVSDGSTEDNITKSTTMLHEKLQIRVCALVTRSFHRDKLIPVTKFEGSIFVVDQREAINMWMWRQQRVWADHYKSYMRKERREPLESNSSPKKKVKAKE